MSSKSSCVFLLHRFAWESYLIYDLHWHSTDCAHENGASRSAWASESGGTAAAAAAPPPALVGSAGPRWCHWQTTGRYQLRPGTSTGLTVSTRVGKEVAEFVTDQDPKTIVQLAEVQNGWWGWPCRNAEDWNVPCEPRLLFSRSTVDIGSFTALRVDRVATSSSSSSSSSASSKWAEDCPGHQIKIHQHKSQNHQILAIWEPKNPRFPRGFVGRKPDGKPGIQRCELPAARPDEWTPPSSAWRPSEASHVGSSHLGTHWQ